MGKVALRGLLAHKTRLIATFLAIALGVGFISGVLTMTDTMNRTFDGLFESAYQLTDAVVRSDETIEGELGEETQRGTVDAALLDEIRALGSVEAATGDVEGEAQVIDGDGDVVGGGAFGSPTIAASWDPADSDDAEHPLNPFRLRDGRWPRSDDEIVLDAQTSGRAGYHVGDVAVIQTGRGVGRYTVVGIVGFGNADSPAGQGILLFTINEAQRMVGEPGRFDTISVVAEEGVPEDELIDDLRVVVGEGVEVLSSTEVKDEAQADLRRGLAFITFFFLAFALVAVLVGCFVIYNAFSIIVAQRTRELALLRAVGASRRQVGRTVLAEAVVVALVGSAAGVLLGLAVASVLMDLMSIEGALAVTPRSVLIAMVCGVVVTVVSAFVPARRSAKVPPVAALREVAVDTAGRSRLRLAIGVVLVALGATGVLLGATGAEASVVGLGVAAAFLGLLFAGPGLARPVSALVGWPLGRLRGVTGVLARHNAGRNPKRSAATAQALMVGVGIVAFFLVINASIRASIDKILDDGFHGDLVVSAGVGGSMGLPPELAETIAARPEVETVVPLRMASATIVGRDQDGPTETNEQLVAMTPAGFPLLGLEIVAGSAELDPGEAVVFESKAEQEGLAVGDQIEVDLLDSTPAPLTVAGIYSASSDVSGIGNYVVGLAELAARAPEATDLQVFVQLAEGVSIEQAEPAIERAVEAYPVAEVQNAEEYKESVGDELDGILRLVLGLLVLAIVIALLGIANTIALSVLERTRELGLLRAVGMSRRQLRSAIRLESVIIALFGTVLGISVGVLGGWGMATAYRDDGFEVFRMPVATLVLLVILAGALGLAAALVPAWRAGRLNVLDAIHTE